MVVNIYFHGLSTEQWSQSSVGCCWIRYDEVKEWPSAQTNSHGVEISVSCIYREP
jgi:hypothetical protein